MENKEIIIDGVDVSKCMYFNKWTDHTCQLEGKGNARTLCKSLDCYFKQLKRKEQECEELKKELQAQRAFTAHEQKLIYCVAYDESCKTGNDCKQKKCIFKDNIKLKQALVEIKEIAEKVYNDCDACYGDVDTNCDVDCIGCRLGGKAELAEQILQKISEAIK